MAKKRRDNKRDPSAGQRLVKFGKAALAVGAGAALLSKTRFSKELLDDYIPAIGKSTENFRRDMLGKKVNAENLYVAFKKNVGFKGQGIQENILKKRAGKIELDTVSRKSLLGKMRDITEYKNKRIYSEAKKALQNEQLEHTIKKLKKDFGDKYEEGAVRDIVMSTFHNRKQITEDGNDWTLDFITKTIHNLGMTEEDASTIVKTTLDDVAELENRYRQGIFSFKAAAEDIAKKQLENLKTKNKRDDLFLNKVGKLFNVDNLEGKLLGSRAATWAEVEEFMGKEDEFFKQTIEDLKVNPLKNPATKETIQSNPWKDLVALNVKDEKGVGALDDAIFDERIRIRTNKDGTKELFSIAESAAYFDSFMEKFNSTLPGKVLTKGIDLKGVKDAPGVQFFHIGKRSFASGWNDDGSVDNIAQSMNVFIDGELYAFDRNEIDQQFHLGKKLAEGWINPHAHGTAAGIEERMLGKTHRPALASNNKWLQKLDINQEGNFNIFRAIKQFLTKGDDPNWERNVIQRVQDRIASGRTADEEISHLMNTMNLRRIDAMRQIDEDNKVVTKLFSDAASSNVIDDHTVMKVINALDNADRSEMSDASIKKISELTQMLNFLINKDTKGAFEYLKQDNIQIRSVGLKGLVDSYIQDPNRTMGLVRINSMPTNKIPVLDIELSETNVANITGMLREEVLKEVMSDDHTWAYIGESISKGDIDITPQQMKSMWTMFHWQKFENAMDISGKGKSVSYMLNEDGPFDLYQTLMSDDERSRNVMLSLLEEAKGQFGIMHKGNFGNANEHHWNEYNSYEFVRKSHWGMDLIKNINDATMWKNALAELNAGRNDPTNVSIVTLGLQYGINRLSYGVESIGLGLSADSLSSPLASLWNLSTKRVLPAMLAYTAFDYLNDTSQDVFGTGITGAAANSARNFDILGRKVAYGTGIGQALDWFKQTSVIGEYWTGSTDFQNAEERADWYENGYSPMRKSRFWSFGSASEVRGGDITFFQPNYWRRIQSDYHDKWLYGGNWEKWKHSFIPTPTHPFSTLRYIANPYWLEEKHIDDAPTPLTGKMFSEGSFWGAILNPTLGEAIKPVSMLPEVRRRLANGGASDSRGIIERINNRIKNKEGVTNDDLLVVNGTDIRNATYVPYGHPTDSELIITNGRAKGLDYMQGLSDIGQYTVPIYDPEAVPTGGYGEASYGTGEGYTTTSRAANAIARGIDAVANELYQENNGAGKEIIKAINDTIKSIGRRGPENQPFINSDSPDSTNEGTYYYNNMVNEYNTYVGDFYEEKFAARDLNKSINQDLLADAKHSVKNLSGIYGFVGEKVFGDNSYTLRYENAGSYQSFSSEFWNANIGGFGGNFMEIARRFFPSEDRSRVNYNPLKNNLPDWLPDYLTVGNPASKLTKHDMRLPGVGYESLNELHPDEFATDGYGAFDRFKILADVAPNSNEYKLWRNIVKHQNLSPDLQEEVKEIEARTKRMRGSHEFYEYQYLHTKTKYETDIVKSVMDDGRILLANNQIITLAGIKFNQNYNQELKEMLTPGQKISYRTTDDVSYDENNNVVRAAAVFRGTDNLNKELMNMGVAERDHMDTSSIGQLATVSTAQEILGGVQELIAHARIPFVHNKLLHIETAREAFESEQINGANFQTWDHPIESFVKPMLNETMRQSMLLRTAAVAYKDFHFNKVLTSNNGKLAKFASGAVLATLDPSAMLGGGLNFALGLNNGRVGSGGQRLGKFSAGMEIGSTIGTVAWGIANADNPFKATTSFALAGVNAFEKFEVADFIWKKWGKKVDWKGAALVSAGIGLAVSALKNPGFDKDKMFGKWQPKKYKKINEMNEYFDRLEYIKYKGLYEDAARKAALFEKANVKDMFKQIDKNKERIYKLQRKSRKLLKKYNENDPRYMSQVSKINEEISALKERGNNMFTGGKYTKSAIAYKKAMESTIYGLSPGATKDEILAAVPDQYKDYFQAFMDETDEDERKKILKMLPDYMKRPLQLAWGQELEEVDSNRKYFKSHHLPGVTWRGWKPNINLKHVKMKTIENEGMILADFGLYDSEKAKGAYQMAPDIDNWDQRSYGFNMALRLGAELRGMGVITSNVSLEKTSTPGFWMTADIGQSIEDRADYAHNKIRNGMETLTGWFL